MKWLFILLTLSIHAHASVDEYSVRTDSAKLPKTVFDRIIRVFEKTFSPLSEAEGRKLEIMTDYQADWAQAFARRWETDQIIVYGGIAALKKGTEDTFALILCHETGHLFGGTPYSDSFNRLSVEGQADYWASSVCFPKILSALSGRTPSRDALTYCGDDLICARTVDAATTITAHFADNRGLPHPSVHTADDTVVDVLNYTHPLPQCRLDTLVAGLRILPRPRCWYPEENL